MQDKKPNRRPTLLDVALSAGVSIASVSRVLNNIPPISKELRSKVEESIGLLGYSTRKPSSSFQPSVVALSGDLQNTYFSKILAGIMNQADRDGYLVNVVINERSPDFPAKFSRWIMHSHAKALILCTSTGLSDEELVRIRELSNLSIIAINRPLRAVGIPSIRIDYERAIANAVRHVAKFNHSRIAFLNGSESAYSSNAKRVGIELTMQELGLNIDKDLFVQCPATIEGGFEGMNNLLQMPKYKGPTAVIASNDLMALGAMHAIKTKGFSIPEDISVVGFDDIDMAAHANPPLTSISPPKFEMGERAMRLVMKQQINRKGSIDEYSIMESPLIVRESSGPCRL